MIRIDIVPQPPRRTFCSGADRTCAPQGDAHGTPRRPNAEEASPRAISRVMSRGRELDAALVSSRTIGDAVVLKDCSLATVAPDCLAASEPGANGVKKLDVSDNSLRSLSGIASTSLTWFSAANNALESNALAALGASCPRIRTLNVSGNDGLRTFDGVQHMKALAALIAKECGIEDLLPIKGLAELNALVCAECQLHDVGDALSSSPALRKLNLSKNHLKKLGNEALKSSRGLRELRLAHNMLKTIPACVASTPNLRILDLGHNRISDWGDLSALRDLGRLEQLNLKGCPIADDPDYEMKIMRMCPGLKILDGRKAPDARGRSREEVEARAQAEEGDSDGEDEREAIREEELVRKEKKAKKEKKEKKEKKQKDKDGGTEGDQSFVDLFISKNSGQVMGGSGAQEGAEEQKDEAKRSGVIGVFENKELKRKGPCGSAAFKALLSANDAGSGLNAGTWDDDDDAPAKKKKAQTPTKKKKDLRDMTPEERKEHLRLQRKRGY